MKKNNQIHHIGFYKLFIIIATILTLSSCNNEDDVIAIFTGKTWKLSYISEDGKHDWVDFWEGDNTAKEEFKQSLRNNEKYCTLTFNGADINGSTGGSFSGQAISTTISGQWSADGKNNKLTINGTSGTEKNAVGKSFIYGLENAQSYSGDENNLFIYYTEGQRTFFLAFAPQKK